MASVVVVGAGIAGLAAAHALSEHDVTVIDGATQVGGKLCTTELAGLRIEEGAETFLARVPEALELARGVGLGNEIVHPQTSSAAVWARGGLRPLPARTVYGVPAQLRSLHGVLTGAETARASVDLLLPGGRGDDESVGRLVRRRLGPAVVDRLVEPLLGGVYAGRSDELSVQATAPILATQGSLMRAVRRAVPASGTPAPVFAAIRDGMGTFVEAVLAASGAKVITGRLVRRIERTTGGFNVVHGPTIDEQVTPADAVVVAVPAAPAARLLADIAGSAAELLAGIDYASMAIVTTVWRRSDLATSAMSGYLVPPSAGRPVKAVTLSSTKWAHVGDAKTAAVRCSFGRHGDTVDVQRDDDELVDLAIDELAATVGAMGRPVAALVSRWGGGLPQYAVGHVDRVRQIRAAVATVPGLAVCGAAYDGVGIPACIRSGQAAAAVIRSRSG